MFCGLFTAICLVALTLVAAAEDDNEDLSKIVGNLARQLMLQQYVAEEKVRMNGNSGLQQLRTRYEGSRPYHTDSHTGASVAAIHNHANSIRTVGLGELDVVLNGVEFRTRHNDYKLLMPHHSSTKYHATEEIPYPDVPPEVTSKATVEEQIDEMKEWFKAWKDQDPSVRDYRKYFKPVLCYLEGFWTHASKDIDESFPSDRHFIDASTWFELQEKLRFGSASGRKDIGENHAFLPTMIQEVVNGTQPVYVQWNYRIACHPLKDDLPLNRLRLAEDLNSRMIKRVTVDMHSTTRAARFELNPIDRDDWEDRGRIRKKLLDRLMNQVPGLDNYVANLTDDSFGSLAMDIETKQVINSGYYNRWFESTGKDAMGEKMHHRSFSDSSIYMAMTTQKKIATMKLDRCLKKKNGKCIEKATLKQKWTYAIPLEIIYLTPLYNWNPYNIEYKGLSNSALGKTVEAGGRNGGFEKDRAFNGTNHKNYFLTPASFFSASQSDSGKADTSGGNTGVLDRKGEVRVVRASGTTITKDIPGVGTVRTRYPIMPIHGHGQAVWKELEALKDMVMNSQSFAHMFNERIDGGYRQNAVFNMWPSTNRTVTRHVHSLELTPEDMSMLMNSLPVTKTTSIEEGHSHTLELRSWKYKSLPRFGIRKCDGRNNCWDGHPGGLTSDVL